jgi:hypothetical protein
MSLFITVKKRNIKLEEGSVDVGWVYLVQDLRGKGSYLTNSTDSLDSESNHLFVQAIQYL